MSLRKCALLFLALLLLLPAAWADEEGGEKIYALVDAQGKLLSHYAGVPEAGDEYIAADNNHYRIERVAHDALTAQAKHLGAYPMPDVSWLSQNALSVSAQRRAVAIYCTHSDESYKPTDGVSSDEDRGGIYDVAETFKKALEQQGVTVYYSDETHHPHDAGAYRRSRATAASLVEQGVDAVLDIHRDGIPDPAAYESEVAGEDAAMVRLLVGRSNQNAQANKEFAAQIKAVADQMYPGLIKDIYIGKGSYNQDLLGQAVLLEFGTFTSDKEDVLTSTGYMADVMNKSLYGGVTGAAGSKTSAAPARKQDSGAINGIFWLIVALVAGALVYAWIASGRGKPALQKFKRTFQEMTGGLMGRKKK